jgi:uncharacterized membrane protein
MKWQRSVEIAAPARSVWNTWVDVERWPEWTTSVTRSTVLDPGPLHVGSRVRVQQPRLPTVVWRVDELEQDQSFVWSSRSAGVTTIASHRITPSGGDRVTALLTLDQSGWLAPVIGFLAGRLTRRYLDMEATGLKSRSESDSADETGQ